MEKWKYSCLTLNKGMLLWLSSVIKLKMRLELSQKGNRYDKARKQKAKAFFQHCHELSNLKPNP